MDTLLLDIIEWDVVNWSSSLNFWERHTSHNLATVSALELGSRHGGLSLWLALKGSRVKCTDLNIPTEQAVEKHKKYAVSHLIEYEAVDAMNIPYDGQFDIVLFKSVLGGIGWNNNVQNQKKAIDQIYYALKPGGELFFVENLIGSPLHRFVRIHFVKWGRQWRYVSINEMKNYLLPFSEVKYECSGVLGAFGRNERQRCYLGKADRFIVNKIIPDEWKYIISGIAVK
jgi:SAM-dependent methyltransferase